MRTIPRFTLTAALLALPVCACMADDDDKTETARPEKAETQSIEITVNETTTTSDDDDQKDGKGVESETKVSGRIIIKGPDGKIEEFNIGDKLPKNLSVIVDKATFGEAKSSEEFRDDFLRFTMQDSEPRFMIGVVCKPVDDALKSHLRLDDGGLVVTNVSPEMPAAEAGIEVHDILLKIGDTNLIDVEQLLKVVSGSEGNELTITALQAGEPKTIKVTPKKSTSKAAIKYLIHSVEEGAEADKDIRMLIERAAGKQWRLGPGMRLKPGTEGEAAKRLTEARDHALKHAEQARKQAEKIQKQVQERLETSRGLQDRESELQQQIKTLRKQQAELETRLKALEGKE